MSLNKDSIAFRIARGVDRVLLRQDPGTLNADQAHTRLRLLVAVAAFALASIGLIFGIGKAIASPAATAAMPSSTLALTGINSLVIPSAITIMWVVVVLAIGILTIPVLLPKYAAKVHLHALTQHRTIVVTLIVAITIVALAITGVVGYSPTAANLTSVEAIKAEHDKVAAEAKTLREKTAALRKSRGGAADIAYLTEARDIAAARSLLASINGFMLDHGSLLNDDDFTKTLGTKGQLELMLQDKEALSDTRHKLKERLPLGPKIIELLNNMESGTVTPLLPEFASALRNAEKLIDEGDKDKGLEIVRSLLGAYGNRADYRGDSQKGTTLVNVYALEARTTANYSVPLADECLEAAASGIVLADSLLAKNDLDLSQRQDIQRGKIECQIATVVTHMRQERWADANATLKSVLPNIEAVVLGPHWTSNVQGVADLLDYSVQVAEHLNDPKALEAAKTHRTDARGRMIERGILKEEAASVRHGNP